MSPAHNSALLRTQIEAALAGRFPSALTFRPRPAPEVFSTGFAQLDAATGGIPRGGLTEICGPPSCGRTSLLLALLAEVTRRQEVCALVDGSDTFDPTAAAAAGVDLRRVLWVRCSAGFISPADGGRRAAPAGVLHIAGSGGSGHTDKTAGSRPTGEPAGSEGSSRPESSPLSRWAGNAETRRNHSGTSMAGVAKPGLVKPGVAKPGLAKPGLGKSGSAPNPPSISPTSPSPQPAIARPAIPETILPKKSAVEQAMQVTDLLLQSGGFGLVAVDFCDIAPATARRVSLTSWFRFRRAVENTPTALIVMEQEPNAGACASLVLDMGQKEVQWSRAELGGAPLLSGLAVDVEMVRASDKRRPVRAGFYSRAAWVGLCG